MFAIAAKEGFHIDHLDVTTAFLHGELEEEIYLEQPEGLKKRGGENKVYKLLKAIYGLKQASCAWNKKIDGTLKSLGFQQSKLEPCVYFRQVKGSWIIIGVYVDDLPLIYQNEKEKEEVKRKLMSIYEMKDLGRLSYFLGINVEQDDNTGEIRLDQERYIKDVLKKFNMFDCKGIATPLEIKQKEKKGGSDTTSPENEHEEEILHDVPYQSVIGSLMYLCVWTRPDIAYAISYLSQFNNKPTASKWKEVKRVLRYLQGSAAKKIVFKNEENNTIMAYADADWAGCKLDRKSFTGFIFKLSDGPIVWESRKQRTVAMSSTEAEYMAMAESVKEAIFLTNLYFEIFGKKISVQLYNDNQGAIKLTKNPILHNKTKHIDLRHHFIRDAVAEKMVRLDYLPTEEMVADVLTKPLGKEKHWFCVDNLLK